MKELNRHLKTQTTALNLFLQSALSIIMGLILFYDENLFFTRVSIVVFAYFWLVMGINFIQVMRNLDKSVKDVARDLFSVVVFGVAIIIYYLNINRIIQLIPPIMLLGTLILAISSMISFIQYRKEKNTAPFRHLISSLLHIGFGIFFGIYTYTYGHFSIGIRIIAGYLILLGVTLFLDGLTLVLSNQFMNYCMSYIKIRPPMIVMAVMPLAILNRMHDYFRGDIDDEMPLTIQKADAEPNVEVYVHVGNTLKGMAGHIDIAIGDTIVCYGTYDRESIHLGGGIGAGVFYEVYDKEVYRRFCQEVRKETLFVYGLTFNEEELRKIEEKLVEIKSRTKIWKCKAQRAMEKNQEFLEPKDMSCKLAQAMDTVFYKFKSGSYKYYWMFGSNCVRFTDELLRASGMMTVVAGIMTPGTYFSYLNDEFAKGNSRIVSRTVYYTGEEAE